MDVESTDLQYIEDIRSKIIKTDMFQFPMVYPELSETTQEVHTHIPPPINIFKESQAFNLFGVDVNNFSNIPIKLHYTVLYNFDRIYIDQTVKHYLYYY